jgi:hypothetical protein
MSMFRFDPSAYAPSFASEGFVHIPKGLTEEFYALLVKQVEEYLETKQLKGYLVGDKHQAVYQLPEGERYEQELLESIGAVCGLDPRALVMSERHIKVYDSDARPNPLAHKDRFASQISVGISVHVPEGSTLVLYPYDHREVNPFNSSTELRTSFTPDRAPELDLARARRVEIQDGPGDVLVFLGNRTWHLRNRPANTTMVYLKFNVWNCDPLGEDPRTPERRDTTMRLLELGDDDLRSLVPMIGRRVDYFQRRYNRNWEEVIGVVLWGQGYTTVDEQEFRLLQAIDGQAPVQSVLQSALGTSAPEQGLAMLRRLAARGIVDLVAAQPAEAARPEPELASATAG